MPLTNLQVDKARPGPKDQKLYDERGLYLLIKKSGSKLWRFKYRFGPKSLETNRPPERLLALGTYPEVPLKLAREKRDAARALLKKNIDPGLQRKKEENAQQLAGLRTFEAVALAWLPKQTWGSSHAARNKRRVEQHVFPWLGPSPIGTVKRIHLSLLIERRYSGDRLQFERPTHRPKRGRKQSRRVRLRFAPLPSHRAPEASCRQHPRPR